MENSNEKSNKNMYKGVLNYSSTSKTPPKFDKPKSPSNIESGTTNKKALKINSSISPVTNNKNKYSHPTKSPENKHKQRMGVLSITNKK